MKVKELKKLIENVDDEMIIVMSKDGEGNSYSPLSGIEQMVYAPDSTWSGEVGFAELTPELIASGYTEEDLLQGEKAVVLYPVN